METLGSKAWSHIGNSLAAILSTDAVREPLAPLPPPRLQGSAASLHTSGVKLVRQPRSLPLGSRYQDYPAAAANFVWAGGLAADVRSQFVFYTQAPQVNTAPRDPGGRMPGFVFPYEYDALGTAPTLVSETSVWVSVLFSRP